MKISFVDFWGGFDANNNFFLDLLQNYKENITVTTLESADVVFFSCFGSEHKNVKNSKKIYFTGENKRPNFEDCDYSLTFDFDTYDNKNIRLPLWLLYIDFFNKKTYTNPSYIIPIDYLMEPKKNPFYIKDKIKFCSIVNNHLANKRDEIFAKLNKINTVNGYGRVFNNQITEGEFFKLETISNYKFHICFENSLYPGYYTEKLLHAKAAGTVPLYYGDINVSNDFNIHGFLNLANYNNTDELVDKVTELNLNDSLFEKLRNEPLFNTVPDLNAIYTRLNSIL